MSFKHILVIPILFFVLGCSVSKLQSKGRVNPQNFYSELLFETYKGIIGLDVTVNGKTKKFLFDTGADLTLVQSDSITGKKSKFSGASKRTMELGQGEVSSIKVGPVEFQNTYALNGNMVGLKEQIPNFDGIIGQSIISKANWLIDYPNKSMEVSNKNLVDNLYKEITTIRENGNNPYTYLEFNEEKYKVVIDFGSSSEINLPLDSKFGKDVTKAIQLADSTRKRYTLGGLQEINEKVGIIPKVRLDEFDFEKVKVNINISSQPRIGMRFLKSIRYTLIILMQEVIS